MNDKLMYWKLGIVFASLIKFSSRAWDLKYKYRLIPIMFVLIFTLFFSCTKDEVTPSGSGLKFLVASNGTATVTKGMYLFNPTANTFEFVCPYLPHYSTDLYLDYRNGRIAMNIDDGPKDSTPVVYVDVTNWNSLRFVPKPQAPTDYFYAVPKAVRPQVLPDGKIVYLVALNTDNPYDDFHIGQLAIFNPKTNQIEISGDPSTFVLSQPEKLADTEGASVGGEFAITPDGKYIYLDVYGYGTDFGQYHQDNWYVVRYEIGSPGNYSRVAHIGRGSSPDHYIESVTGDGKFLVLSGNDEIKVELTTNAISKFDDYGFNISVGAFSPSSSKLLKMWRCGGIALFDLNVSPSYQFTVIEASKMTGPNRGLGNGLQFSKDETKIYFTGSTDYCTNYDGPLRIYATTLIDTNIAPDSISSMPIDYCTKIFQLIGK